jgi:hypothetical protein
MIWKHRLCYIIAICISRTNGITKPMQGISTLLDFKGFLDARYSVLALGAFITMLGQFVPYYYISPCITYQVSNKAF